MLNCLYLIYGFFRRFLLSTLKIKTVGVRAIIVKNHQVLLVRHTYIDGWYLPGGGVNAHESPVQAAIREVHEEVAGVVAEPLQLLGIYYNRKPGWDDYVVLYKAELTQQHKVTDQEIAEARWFDLDKLPSDITESTKSRINEHVFGKPPEDCW